jgi:hypothetical protein
MKHKLVLAAALAAVAGGVTVSTAQAAPASGSLIGAHAADALVQKAHYDDYRRRGPWWWNSRRYDNDYRWNNKPWWWKRHHGRDWSSRDDDRRGRDSDRRRRDW